MEFKRDMAAPSTQRTSTPLQPPEVPMSHEATIITPEAASASTSQKGKKVRVKFYLPTVFRHRMASYGKETYVCIIFSR